MMMQSNPGAYKDSRMNGPAEDVKGVMVNCHYEYYINTRNAYSTRKKTEKECIMQNFIQ